MPGLAASLALLAMTHGALAGNNYDVSDDPTAQTLRDVLPPEAFEVVAGAMGLRPLPAQSFEIVDPGTEFRHQKDDGIIIRTGNVPGVPVIALPPLDVPALLAEDAQHAMVDKTLRYGLGRTVTATVHNGAWVPAAASGDAGWVWALDIHPQGALGTRVHVQRMNLPEGATLVVFNPDDLSAAYGPFDERGIFDDGEFWTPMLQGERVRLEVFVPGKSSTPPNQPLFDIDAIQHIYRDPIMEMAGGGGGGEGGIAGAGGCHNNVACYNQWKSTAKAVAGIGFINTNSLFCTGQLLNPENDDFTPYFLTANHCLSTNSDARSSEVFWKYQSNTCGSLPPSIFSVASSSVCTLLRTGASSDYTLLMIEGKLPTGLTWAGWNSNAVADGSNVVCIHHPQGSYKRISFGSKASNPVCGGGAGTHLRVNWSDGPTEPGSSGSGAFLVGSKQLIGQLHCGPSGCGSETNDAFGAFTNTYPNMSDLLAGGSDDAFETNDGCGQAAVLGAGTHANLVVKSVDPDWYRITVPAGKRLRVTARFKHLWGDIDLRLYPACGQTPIDSSTGTTNTERVVYINSTGSVQELRVRAYLFSDVRNKYKLIVRIDDP